MRSAVGGVPADLAADLDHVTVAEDVHCRRPAEQAHDVGCSQDGIACGGQHQRGAVACHHEGVRVAGEDGNRPRALGLRERPPRALHERPPGSALLFDQVHEDFAVHLGAQLMPPSAQFGAKFGRVVDDSVVHQREVAVAVTVGMSVANGGRAVGRPPGVADAEPAAQRLSPGVHLTLQGEKATRRSDHLSSPAPGSHTATPAES